MDGRLQYSNARPYTSLSVCISQYSHCAKSGIYTTAILSVRLSVCHTRELRLCQNGLLSSLHDSPIITRLQLQPGTVFGREKCGSYCHCVRVGHGSNFLDPTQPDPQVK